MVRHGLLLIAAAGMFSSVALFPMLAAAAPPAGCSSLDALDGSCSISGSINGGGVDLSGHKDSPGNAGGNAGAGGAGGGGTSTGNGGGNGGGNGKSGRGTPKPAEPVCTGLPAACQKFIVIPPGTPGNPSLTIKDLKSFPASPGTDHMEPNGWMIVGLDTNFYSVVGVEVVNGTLLGRPASVRFTPMSWQWTYGDGRSAARSTPGATWAAQGIPEFDPTTTSHVYTEAGTYFIDLSITFRAEYKYSTGNWTPVYGTITLPANRLKATAGDAKTVLVSRDCTQNPSGPGC